MDASTHAEDRSLYTAAGAAAAILLGMTLVPLRETTTASNFAFVFVALTIVFAEFGGRVTAVVVALTSALSLNFFLTKPYLTLQIESKHDVFAFVGITACGLVAAVLGTRRAERMAALRAARRHQALFHEALRETEAGGPVEIAATKVLQAARTALPLVALSLLDERGSFVAASDADRVDRRAERVLRPDTLLPAESPVRDVPRRGLALPIEGGRLPLRFGNRDVGSLVIWGNGEPASADARRMLSDLGRLLGMLLVERTRTVLT